MGGLVIILWGNQGEGSNGFLQTVLRNRECVPWHRLEEYVALQFAHIGSIPYNVRRKGSVGCGQRN